MPDLDKLTEETVSLITEAQAEGLDREETVDALAVALLPAFLKLSDYDNPTV